MIAQTVKNRYDSITSLLWSRVARRLRFPRRFVIITSGRSGSELLVSLLDSHPAVVCEGEILQRPRRHPGAYLRGHALRMTLRARHRRSIPAVHGWKLVTNHVRWYPEVFPDARAFVDELVADGSTIIHLRRRNLLNQALSLICAEQTQFHYRSGDRRLEFAPVVFEPERLLAQLYHYEEDDQWLTKTIGDLPRLELTYEDDLADPAAQEVTAARVFRELGLAPAEIAAGVHKVAPPDPRGRIANHAEVARALAGTRYEELLGGLSGD